MPGTGRNLAGAEDLRRGFESLRQPTERLLGGALVLVFHRLLLPASVRPLGSSLCPGEGFERFWAQKLPALAAPVRLLAAGTALLNLMLCRRPFILGEEAQTRAVYEALFREEGQ